LEGGGEKKGKGMDGIVVGIVGKFGNEFMAGSGGRVNFGRFGIVGRDGIVGIVVGNVVGNGGRVGNVVGIGGRVGNVGFGKVGAAGVVCRRLRAASPMSMPEKEIAMKKKANMMDLLKNDIDLQRIFALRLFSVCAYSKD
jgi:hypothetical protein